MFPQWKTSNTLRVYLKDNIRRLAPNFSDFQTHNLRKTKIRSMLKGRQYDIAEVQLYAHHADIRSTQRYVEAEEYTLLDKIAKLNQEGNNIARL